MTKKKIVTEKDLGGKSKFIIDRRKLHEEILAVIEGIGGTDIQQPIVVSKINNEKGMPSPQDGRERSSNWGEGLNCIYGKKPLSNQEDYPEGLDPFASALKKIKPSASENEELRRFKSAVVKAKSASKVNKVVNQALGAGIRVNACHEGEWSFAEYVILNTHFNKFKKGELKKIMHELMLKGAVLDEALLQNKLIGETYTKLQQEVKPQRDKQLEELKKVSESAVRRGTVIDVEIDNTTFYMEFSKDSVVEVAKVLEGAKNLELNKGEVKLGGDIIKIGESEVEVKSEKGGEKNYIDVSEGSKVIITFPTSMGGLRIRMYHDAENDRQVQVRVVDKEMWSELQKRDEVVGKGCLFGGMTVKEAVERGSFTRCGIWSEKQAIKEIKEVNNASETLSSWVDKTRGDSKETSRGL